MSPKKERAARIEWLDSTGRPIKVIDERVLRPWESREMLLGIRNKGRALIGVTLKSRGPRAKVGGVLFRRSTKRGFTRDLLLGNLKPGEKVTFRVLWQAGPTEGPMPEVFVEET